MSFAIHDDIVPALVRALQQLRHALQKGKAHADAQGWDPAVLLAMRLAPDMFPLTRQVQIATDIAKGAVARLSAGEAPKFDDDETTFEQLDARIVRALEYIASVPATAYDGAESRAVVIPTRVRGDLHFDGRGYLLGFVLPNVYFHGSMTYALLRHAGVPLGKADFLGPIGQS
jgi:uncharacterized protein